MENITQFIETNLNTYLLFVIILGGIFIVKYTKEYTKLKDVYKVFLASIFFSVIFYFIDENKSDHTQQYLFTYLFATSFYEIFVKWVIDKITKSFGIKSSDITQLDNEVSSIPGGGLPPPKKQ
jgi:hypothetical protein